ncbi:hypothetical protein EDC04DRAFT_2613440 [Pisolithus marmoratus]|nr:hypothetical protein EDC04DRAFT_2613440 [Pisolithus marmoratus]
MGKLDMYKPFIKEIKPFAPELHWINSHAQGDRKNGYDFDIKPDVSVYHESLDGPIPKGCNISNLNMHIEFNWHRCNDLFLASSLDGDQVAFLGYSNTQQDTLGQIGAYAAVQLASQFCMHVPPELCGINTSVSHPSKDKATSARAKLGLLVDMPMLKTTIPRSDDGSPLTHVPYVSTCLASGDIQCWPKQEMQMKKELVQAICNVLVGELINRHIHWGFSTETLVQGMLLSFEATYTYLINWDLAKARSTLKPCQATHTDDLESSFWVLLWTVVMFSESSLSIESCSNFIRGIFKSAPGGEGKWSMLVSQQKLKEGLFPGWPSLYQLLKDLVDLFAYDYYTPGDSKEWNLLVFTEEPSTREKVLMEAFPIFHHKQSVERLQSHDYIIKCFVTHLNSST